MKLSRSLLLLIMLTFTSVIALADVPSEMMFQGYLTDIAGAPLNSSVAMTVTLYDAETDGNALWSENTSVLVENGVFTIHLGEVNPMDANVFQGQGALWIGVKVESTG